MVALEMISERRIEESCHIYAGMGKGKARAWAKGLGWAVQLHASCLLHRPRFPAARYTDHNGTARDFRSLEEQRDLLAFDECCDLPVVQISRTIVGRAIEGVEP